MNLTNKLDYVEETIRQFIETKIGGLPDFRHQPFIPPVIPNIRNSPTIPIITNNNLPKSPSHFN